MSVLDRYLQAVARLLPKERRGDIVEELRANILSQIEDREQALGRPLTEEEQAAILRHHGNPTVIASRYRPDNLGLAFGKQLIGPELFPFYKTTLNVSLVITAVVLAGLLPALARDADGGLTLTRALFPLVTQFVVITLIFIILDRNKGSILNKWDPRALPALKTNPEEGPTTANIFSFISTAVGTFWMALTPHWPFLMLGPGVFYLPQLGLKFWPQWPAFYTSIIVLLCAQLVLQFSNLFRGLRRRNFRVVDVILRSIGLAIGILLLLQAPNYVTSQYPEVAYWANLNFEIGVVVAVGITLWQLGRILFTLFRERHQMLPARQY